MTDSPSVAPSEPNDNDETRDLVNSIWRSGWKAGDKHGYRLGFTNGSSTLGRAWFAMMFVFAMFLGGGVGMGLDYFVSCVDTVVGEDKQCVPK
jgi:hypothetical protein